jgi:hypothetical protein
MERGGKSRPSLLQSTSERVYPALLVSSRLVPAAPIAIATATAAAAATTVATAAAATASAATATVTTTATTVTATTAAAATTATLAAEAVRAVNRAIATRLERDFGLLAARSAYGRVHLAGAAAVAATTIAARVTLRLAGGATIRTAGRLAEALASKELLLASREGELGAAIAAREGLVLHVRLGLL